MKQIIDIVISIIQINIYYVMPQQIIVPYIRLNSWPYIVRRSPRNIFQYNAARRAMAICLMKHQAFLDNTI